MKQLPDEMRLRLARMAAEAVLQMDSWRLRSLNSEDPEEIAEILKDLRTKDKEVELTSLPAPTEATMDAFLSALVETAKEREALLNKLRAALEKNQTEQALSLAREYCNVPDGRRLA